MIVKVNYEHLKYKEYLYDDTFVFHRIFGRSLANYRLISADDLTVKVDVYDAEAFEFLTDLLVSSNAILLAKCTTDTGKVLVELGTGLVIVFRFIVDYAGMFSYITGNNSTEKCVQLLMKKAESDALEIFVKKCYEEVRKCQ